MSIRVYHSALFSTGDVITGGEISLQGMSYRVVKYLLLRQYIIFLPIRACHSRQDIFDCKSGKPHVTRCEYKRGIHFVVCRIRVAGYESISLCLPQDSTQHSVNEGIGPHDYVCVTIKTCKSLSVSDNVPMSLWLSSVMAGYKVSQISLFL